MPEVSSLLPWLQSLSPSLRCSSLTHRQPCSPMNGGHSASVCPDRPALGTALSPHPSWLPHGGPVTQSPLRVEPTAGPRPQGI